MDRTSRVHFIGIGGAGMSGIAKVLLEMGYSVSGSDLKVSRYTTSLQEYGAKITIGHRPENLNDPDVVVISSAIPERNPELIRAREMQVPILARAEMLSQLARGRKAVAVAGTHGKTTTTSMISFILQHSGADPTYLIGGELNDIGSNARYGSGEYCIVEADESDGSLIHLHPWAMIITNIEADHLDFYDSFEAIERLFAEWMKGLPDDGLAIVQGDNSNVQALAEASGKTFLTYGLDDTNDFFIRDIVHDSFGVRFVAYSQFDDRLGRIRLQIPGVHNALNALAAAAFCLEAGVDFDSISAALALFRGVKRRFQLIGQPEDIAVIDDYAHHPTEVQATLKAARLSGRKRVICVFQPHRYSRAKSLHREFGRSFADADLTVMTDVYSAGEEPIPGVSGKLLVDSILDSEPGKNVVYLPKRMDIGGYLASIVRRGDIVLTMGAGDIWMVGDELVSRLSAATAGRRKVERTF